MNPRKIRLRFHHFLCIHGFKGRGYSPDFVKNFWDVLNNLNSDGNARVIEATRGLDEICVACPKNLGDVCNDQAKIEELDNAHRQITKIEDGKLYSLNEAKKIVAEKISLDDFEKICRACSWRELGYCRDALKRLKSSALLLMAVLLFSTQSLRADTIEDVFQGFAKKNGAQLKIDSVAAELYQLKKKYDEIKVDLGYGRRDKVRKESKEFEKKAQALESKLKLSIEKKTLSRIRGLVFVERYKLTDPKLKKARIELIVKAVDFLDSASVLSVLPQSMIDDYIVFCTQKKIEACFERSTRLLDIYLKNDRQRELAKMLAVATQAQQAQSQEKPVAQPAPPAPVFLNLPERETDLQLFDRGFKAYREKKFDEAYILWRKIIQEYPATTIRFRSKFWMARSAQKAGQLLHAETLYREILRDLPLSYYGLLSSWFSGIEIGRSIETQIPDISKRSDQLSEEELTALSSAEQHLLLKEKWLAAFELQKIRINSKFENSFLVYLIVLNHLAGNHLFVFQSQTELTNRPYRGMMSVFGLKLLFPLEYKAVAAGSLSGKSGVDPLVVLSLMKQESAFNVAAISRSYAFGIMQVILPTARDIEKSVESLDLLDPKKGAQIGTRYLLGLLEKYQGDLVSALGAYNAGPGAMARWLRNKEPTMPIEEFIETVSYRETREYIQNILRNYYWYRRMSGDSIPKNIGELVLVPQYVKR